MLELKSAFEEHNALDQSEGMTQEDKGKSMMADSTARTKKKRKG